MFKSYRNYETLLYSFLIIGLSLIQTIITTKFFVQKSYGTYGFYISLSQVLLILTQWGFSSWGVNELSKIGESNFTVLLNKIIISKFIVGGISLIALVAYIKLDSGKYDIVLIFAYLLYFLSLVFSLEVLYISLAKVNKMIKISFYSKFFYTIFFCSILYFFKISPRLMLILFAIQSIMNSFFLYLNQSDFKIRLNIIRSKIDGIIYYSSSNFILVFCSFLFASGPVLYAGHFLSKEAFAVVYASTAIIKLVQASYQPMIQKILPKLNNGLSVEFDMKLAIFFAITATITLFLFAPLIVKIVFNHNYNGILPAIRLFSFSIIPGIMSTIIISQWAVYANQVRYMYICVAIIAVISFMIYTIFSKSLTWQFIIWTMLLSELLLFCTVFILKQMNQKTVKLY